MTVGEDRGRCGQQLAENAATAGGWCSFHKRFPIQSITTFAVIGFDDFLHIPFLEETIIIIGIESGTGPVGDIIKDINSDYRMSKIFFMSDFKIKKGMIRTESSNPGSSRVINSPRSCGVMR